MTHSNLQAVAADLLHIMANPHSNERAANDLSADRRHCIKDECVLERFNLVPDDDDDGIVRLFCNFGAPELIPNTLNVCT